MKTVFEFIKENWAWIALVISELLPLISEKYRGIVQTVFKILGKIFEKPANTSKKIGVILLFVFIGVNANSQFKYPYSYIIDKEFTLTAGVPYFDYVDTITVPIGIKSISINRIKFCGNSLTTTTSLVTSGTYRIILTDTLSTVYKRNELGSVSPYFKIFFVPTGGNTDIAVNAIYDCTLTKRLIILKGRLWFAAAVFPANTKIYYSYNIEGTYQ